MEIVSGLGEKPHVTSQQFRQILEGTIGQKSYIVTSGENLEPELAANNLLKIRSGMMSHHGNVSSVKIGTYDEVELTNGSQGMKRIDLVVNRYTRNAETNIEKNEWVVIMGTPVASNPVAPAYTVGNLQKGDLVDDCPVFELHYDGINVTEVKKMLSVLPNVAELNSKIPKIKSGTKILQGTGNRYLELFTMAELEEMFGVSNTDSPNYVIYACNADDSALGQIDNGIAYTTDAKAWMLWFESNITSGKNVRINYSVTFNPDIS
ncbi:hypothetical protein [Dorea formicigenerans]|uniref:hypothetical protein n=1 Tax=Dorea formicigenerans TaxID=39486 RepID=UPI001FA90B4C|nr:hypothetical protein [Dorea formicigenerans]